MISSAIWLGVSLAYATDVDCWLLSGVIEPDGCIPSITAATSSYSPTGGNSSAGTTVAFMGNTPECSNDFFMQAFEIPSKH